jgi:hypothetical protein
MIIIIITNFSSTMKDCMLCVSKAFDLPITAMAIKIYRLAREFLLLCDQAGTSMVPECVGICYKFRDLLAN